MDSTGKSFKNWNFLQSFNCATKGILRTIQEESHFRFHLVTSCVVILLALCLHFSRIEWLLLLLTISQVIVAELINTAIEAAVDLSIGDNWHAMAKKAKDIAAGAVLLAAGMAVVMGIILFGPYLLSIITN